MRAVAWIVVVVHAELCCTSSLVVVG